MANLHEYKILIIDFGSQYTQLIARRVREIGIYSEIIPYDCDATEISDFQPNGIILSGGPESTTAGDAAPKIPAVVFDLNANGTPILGICYGMQALTMQLGGKVISSDAQEFGHAEVRIAENSPLLTGIGDAGKLDVWMSHGDKVTQLAGNFSTIAQTAYLCVVLFQSIL